MSDFDIAESNPTEKHTGKPSLTSTNSERSTFEKPCGKNEKYDYGTPMVFDT
jgi:hypothetical protein